MLSEITSLIPAFFLFFNLALSAPLQAGNDGNGLMDPDRAGATIAASCRSPFNVPTGSHFTSSTNCDQSNAGTSSNIARRSATSGPPRLVTRGLFSSRQFKDSSEKGCDAGESDASQGLEKDPISHADYKAVKHKMTFELAYDMCFDRIRDPHDAWTDRMKFDQGPRPASLKEDVGRAWSDTRKSALFLFQGYFQAPTFKLHETQRFRRFQDFRDF